MTVYIEKPALNLREELASLRNQGGYQEQQFYFDGLVTNGDFATDTNWTKGTGWTISGGVASFNNPTGTALTQAGSFAANTTYAITFTTSGSSVYVTAQMNGGGGAEGTAPVTTTGTSTVYLTTSIARTAINFVAIGGANYSIDNISIFKVDASNDVIHTMPQGWKPKDFFEDGLLQREGAANDYEVVFDGFDYVVKPTVAPSATTQSCVIGVKA